MDESRKTYTKNQLPKGRFPHKYFSNELTKKKNPQSKPYLTPEKTEHIMKKWEKTGKIMKKWKEIMKKMKKNVKNKKIKVWKNKKE